MQKQCPYCTNMIDTRVEYCPYCRAKNIKEYTLEEYSANAKSHSHTGDSLCNDDDNKHTVQVQPSKFNLVILIIEIVVFLTLYNIIHPLVSRGLYLAWAFFLFDNDAVSFVMHHYGYFVCIFVSVILVLLLYSLLVYPIMKKIKEKIK